MTHRLQIRTYSKGLSFLFIRGISNTFQFVVHVIFIVIFVNRLSINCFVIARLASLLLLYHYDELKKSVGSRTIDSNDDFDVNLGGVDLCTDAYETAFAASASLIKTQLADRFPHIPTYSSDDEIFTHDKIRNADELEFFVSPLDGARDFVIRNDKGIFHYKRSNCI